MSPPVTGIAEIAVNVRDLPQMREFYCDVLGFQVHSESCHEKGPKVEKRGKPTISFLTVGPLESPLGKHGHPLLLVLIDYRRHYSAKDRFKGHEPSRSRLNHLAFEIPPASYTNHKLRLETLGLNPTTAQFPNMNAKAMFFEDPEGNMVELICHAE